MRHALAYVTFWFCCLLYEFREELPEQKQTLERRQYVYTLCTFIWGQKDVTKVCSGRGACEICVSFANVCRSMHLKANCFSSPRKYCKCMYSLQLFHDAER